MKNIVPNSDLLFRQNFLRLVHHARAIESSGGGQHDRSLITGGWAMSQLLRMDRELKDIDIWAEGPLAARKGKNGREQSELKMHLLRTMRDEFLNRNQRGWKERYFIEAGQVTVPYDYTKEGKAIRAPSKSNSCKD